MYKTPGVYVEEIATLPPSVAEVETAIPAFLGRTELGASGAVEVAQVSSLLEYEERFGEPKPTTFTATKDGVVNALKTNIPDTPLWYALNLYFKNGGSRCYVISIDNHANAAAAARYDAGLQALAAIDEPTLIVMPEAAALSAADFATVSQSALAQAGTLGDRFAILDVKDGDVDAFRTGIGTNYLRTARPITRTSTPSIAARLRRAPASEGRRRRHRADDLASLKTTQHRALQQHQDAARRQRVDLPPSAAIAGIYARSTAIAASGRPRRTSRLPSVIGPTVQITSDQQEALNVDPDVRQVDQRDPRLHRQGNAGLGRPHAGRQRQRVALRQRPPLVHHDRGVGEERHVVRGLRAQRRLDLAQGQGDDRELPLRPVGAGRASGREAGTGVST